MYILVRDKRGVSASDRVDELIKSPVFSGANRVPYALAKDKIRPIVGDASLERLGMSADDWKRLASEVNVIFNSAASVRFDDPIKKALAINCQPTVCCLQLARESRHLAAYVHVSTCYAYCHLPTTEEKVYPTAVTYEKLENISKMHDDEALDKLCREKFFEGRPNSYVFTKALAENYLVDHAQGVPTAIGRLSMVAGARREPEVGFIDVLQAGMFVGFTQAMGALRTFDFDPSVYLPLIHVDTAANSLLTIGWLTADKYRHQIRVYNCTECVVPNAAGLKVFEVVNKECPSLRAFRPTMTLDKKPSWLSYNYNRWISEWLFVFILEKILRLFGLKQCVLTLYLDDVLLILFSDF